MIRQGLKQALSASNSAKRSPAMQQVQALSRGKYTKSHLQLAHKFKSLYQSTLLPYLFRPRLRLCTK